jgi:Tfp pilus assembly protein PilZ
MTKNCIQRNHETFQFYIFRFDKTKYTFQKSPICVADFFYEEGKTPPYFIDGDNVKYTVIKNKYIRQNTDGYNNENNDYFIENDTPLPEKYYWKSPDGWLYLYDKNKRDVYSINIITPSQSKNTLMHYIANSGVTLFTTECFKITEKINLRIGLKDIYEKYEKWCKKNHKDCLKTQKQFKEELEKLNYKESESKGVGINGRSGKRGYNILVELLD